MEQNDPPAQPAPHRKAWWRRIPDSFRAARETVRKHEAVTSLLLFLAFYEAVKKVESVFEEGGAWAMTLRVLFTVIAVALAITFLRALLRCLARLIKWRLPIKQNIMEPLTQFIVFLGGGVVALLVWHNLPAKRDSTPPPEPQQFVMSYRAQSNCNFMTVAAPSVNTAIMHNRKGVLIYGLAIANNTGKGTTLQDVVLAYEHKGNTVEANTMALPTGTLKTGAQGILATSGKVRVVLANWNHLRQVFLERKEKGPGGVWYGDAMFLFDSDVQSFSDVSNLKLIARDYLGNKGEFPISPQPIVFTIRNEPFVQKEDGSFVWPQ